MKVINDGNGWKTAQYFDGQRIREIQMHVSGEIIGWNDAERAGIIILQGTKYRPFIASLRRKEKRNTQRIG